MGEDTVTSMQEAAGMSFAQRLNLRVVAALNENPGTKKLFSSYLRTFGAWWVHKATEKIIQIEGLDELQAMQPERGMIVAANHRSFFDFYVISSILLRNTHLAERIYFPVRTNFFYESPVGLLVNGVVGGFAMYPPIYREEGHRELNDLSLRRVEQLLQQKGVLVGFHPEGTRGKGPDPFELLPAQPGVGRVVYQSRVPVVPAFIFGLTNDFLHQLVNGVRGKVDPVYAFFGKPIGLDDLYAQSPRASTYLRISRRIRDEISSLGQRVKALEDARLER